MHARLSFACAALGSAVLTAQTTVVDYRFDSSGAATVVNYAGTGSPAPSLGHLLAATSRPLSYGRSGHALRGRLPHQRANVLATGWNGAFQGPFSLGFWVHNRGSNSPAVETDLLGTGAFRVASGGVAGTRLAVFGWGGPPLRLDSGDRLCDGNYWSHIALVVDPTAGTATWYRAGRAVETDTISVVPTVTATTEGFHIGCSDDPATGSLYDLDEVRFVLGAVDAATIAAWAGDPLAAVATFGTGSPSTALEAIGMPQLGSAYALAVQGPASSSYALAFGTSRETLGTLPLPLDLGSLDPRASGLLWHVSIDAAIAGTLSGGKTNIALPLPADPSLAGVELFAQSLLIEPSGALAITPALAQVLGH